MGRQRHYSLFRCSFGHSVFVAFALLALLPSLTLVRIGTLLLLDGTPSSFALVEVGALAVFVVFCLITGLAILTAITHRVQTIDRQSRELRENAILAPEQQENPADAMLPSSTPQPLNELDSLTQTIGALHSDIADKFSRLKDQALLLESLRHVLETSDDMVVVTDADDSVLFSNRAAVETFGILPEQTLTYAISEGRLTCPDPDHCREILGSWEDQRKELTFVRPDGGSVIMEVDIAVTEDNGSGRTRVLVIRDITAHRRLERQLYRSEKLASLGQLISGVAHELNNPLAAILGFAELCRGSSTKAEIDRNLEVVEREARRTAHIVENLLSFSRQRKADRSPCDVHELVERCLGLLAHSLRKNSISVRRAYAPDLPEVKLDEYQVQQVLMNIILNAAQAVEAADVEAPQIEVRTFVCQDRKAIAIEFRDNGPGIPDDMLEQVFEPFVTTKTEEEGTGLGLPVSLSIVRSHDGDIAVESPPGQGAIFTVTLPTTDMPAKPGRHQKRPTVRRQLRGRVLAIDDEPSLLEMTRAALSDIGLQVDTVGTLREGLAQLCREDYDLILVDVFMPDGNGLQILRFVRKNIPALSNRIAFITGDPRVSRRIEQEGGVDTPVLQKPFHVKDLIAMVERKFEELGSRRTTPTPS